MSESTEIERELLVLRRATDQDYRDRLKHLETRIDEIDQRINEELMENHRMMEFVTHQMQKIIDRQAQYEPAMEAMQKVVLGGMAMRWIVLFVITTLAAIGTGATAWEAIQKVLK